MFMKRYFNEVISKVIVVWIFLVFKLPYMIYFWIKAKILVMVKFYLGSIILNFLWKASLIGNTFKDMKFNAMNLVHQLNTVLYTIREIIQHIH